MNRLNALTSPAPSRSQRSGGGAPPERWGAPWLSLAVSCAALISGACSAPAAVEDPFLPRDPGAARAPSTLGERLLGAWSDPAGGRMMRFEPTRVVTRSDGALEFRAARYGEESLVVLDNARFTELSPQLDGDLLVIEDGGTEWTLERLDAVPGELRLETFEFGAPRMLTSARVAEIQEQLDARRREDQAVREDMSSVPHAELVVRLRRVDSDNTAWLRELCADIGWIDGERFGSDAANAAFLLVQHSGDLSLMQAALPEIEADWRAGIVPGGGYALLHDRLSLALGRPQLYGSQLGGRVEGPLFILPLSDAEDVDRRRAEVGLQPLDEYLQFFVEGDEPPPTLLEWPAL